MTGFGIRMLGTFSFLGGWISMFGEKITIEVIAEQAKKIADAREKSTLAVDANGLLNTAMAGTLVKKNNFYGQ